MTERTRQIILGLFLAGVLVFTVAFAGLFAAHRCQLATALGQPIISNQLGFSIRMPRDWEPGLMETSDLFSTLAYTRPLDRTARMDSLTSRTPRRQIFFFAIRPGATDEQALTPLLSLVRLVDINDNDFYAPQPIDPRPTRLGPYEQRAGGFHFRYRRLAYPLVLIRYQQIMVGKRVFWCVMLGNTQLNEADQALLRAVAAGFQILPDESVQTE